MHRKILHYHASNLFFMTLIKGTSTTMWSKIAYEANVADYILNNVLAIWSMKLLRLNGLTHFSPVQHFGQRLVICLVKVSWTGFYTKCNTGLKWVKIYYANETEITIKKLKFTQKKQVIKFTGSSFLKEPVQYFRNIQ